MVADFAPARWYVTLFYTLAIVAVGFHLRHGIFSALRTLGQQTPRGERRARAVALVFAVVLVRRLPVGARSPYSPDWWA